MAIVFKLFRQHVQVQVACKFSMCMLSRGTGMACIKHLCFNRLTLYLVTGFSAGNEVGACIIIVFTAQQCNT